jgi:hypothetical protein
VVAVVVVMLVVMYLTGNVCSRKEGYMNSAGTGTVLQYLHCIGY